MERRLIELGDPRNRSAEQSKKSSRYVCLILIL